jgi:hypothetical protein
MDMNSEVLNMYADYLTQQSCFITGELISEILQDCEVSEEYAYFVLLAAATGLEMDSSERDRRIAHDYYIPSIMRLKAKDYRENPYYRNITIPEISTGNWELKYEKYQPYEAFIYNDLMIDENFREIPRLGFFAEEFLFPAVLEKGIEWMTITPNEIATMQPALEEVEGKVVTFGLGLGYFAYMASEKEQVHQLTIIERNEEVIRLFKEYILPQFSHKDKVEIITMDAFVYAKEYMAAEAYDYAFVDLWHDVSDGVELYLRMKGMEIDCPKTKYLYWIEESLLSCLRRYVFLTLLEGIEKESPDTALMEQVAFVMGEETVSSGQLENDRTHKAVAAYLEDKYISSFEEFIYYLSNPFLRILAKELGE